MSKVFFLNVPLQSHVIKTTHLVRRLIEEGEDVTYSSAEALRNRFESIGAKYISMESLISFDNLPKELCRYAFERTVINNLKTEKEKYYVNYCYHFDDVSNNYLLDKNLSNEERNNLSNIFLQLFKNLSKMSARFYRFMCFNYEMNQLFIPFYLNIIEKDKPDYIIHDSNCSWGRIIANYLKVPAISSISTPPISKKSWYSVSTFLYKTAMFLIDIPHYFTARKLRSILAKRYNNRNMSVFHLVSNESILNLVYTSREYIPN